MSDESIPGPTPTGYQRTQGGGVKWVPPTAEHLGKLLPQYDIECILGFGGMGAVYKGKQKSLDRTVAIKILPPGLEDEDASYVDRFKNEARIMAKLDHPAIVPVYDFGETTEGQLYIVMSFVDGTDVQKMLQQQGRLPSEHALAVTAHVCDALKYAHEHGVIHRDIKPANILINMDGAVKVADFGLAKADEAGSSGITKTGMAMGTPDYVAPEALVMGVNVDGRADLYAVGVMLYAMLTGNVPRGAFKPASVQVPGTDPRFDKIVQKAMQMDRDERYQTAAEIRRDLDVILTTPLVQAGGQSSAAIPKAAVAQKPVAKGPQKPMGKSANVPVRKEAAAAPAPNPQSEIAHPKSKAPLFIGIGAVAAIAVGAFVMMGGKKPDVGDDVRSLTSSSAASEQQRLVTSSPTPTAPIKVREDPKPASSVSSSPLPVTKSPSAPAVSQVALPSISPTGWQPLFTQAEWRVSDDDREFVDGLLHVKRRKLLPRAQPSADGAIRARIIYREGTRNPFVVARSTESDGHYVLGLGTDAKHVFLGYFKTLNSEGNILARHFLPRPLASGDGLSLELILQGDRLIGLVDGTPVIDAHDTHLKQPGRWGIYAASGWFESVEVQPLGAAANAVASATPAASSPTPSVAKSSTAPAASSPSLPVSLRGSAAKSSDKFPPGQWVKLFTKFEDLPDDLRKPDSGVKFEDGWLNLGSKQVWLRFPASLSSNYGIRARFRHRKNAFGSIVLRRQEASKPALYQLRYLDNHLNCQRRDDATYHDIKSIAVRKTPQSQNESTLEFAAVGSRLIGRLDLDAFATGIDATHATGVAHIYGDEDIRDIEVINLDGIPEAEALRILGVDEKGNDLRALAAKQEQQKAEQAKAADAMAAIPELKTLHEQFVKLQAERVTAPFAADVAKLNTGYLGGLDREIEKEKKAGHLDGVIVLEAEKKLIPLVGRLGETAGGDSQSRPTMPIPAEDDDATPANLKGLRQIYRDAFAKLEATRAANLKLLTDPLSIRLKQLESTLTQKNRVPDAKTVREYREGLGRAAALSAAASSPADTNSPNAALAGASALLKKKFPPGDDRKAAEWVLSVGGTVSITGVSTRVTDVAELPRGRFVVTSVYLEFSADKRPLAPINDLQPLAGLKSLSRLHLKELPLEDAHLEIIPSLPALNTLWTEKTGIGDSVFARLVSSPLQSLQFKVEPKITCEGISALRSCKELFALHLHGCQPTEEGLRQVGSLEDLTSLTFSNTHQRLQDSHLPLLGRLKKLTLLNLRRTQVTAEGLIASKVWSGLTNLGFDPLPEDVAKQVAGLAAAFPKVDALLIEGDPTWIYSADNLRALKGFPRLRKLTCTGPLYTDEVMSGLLEMDGLEELIISNDNKLTDASLDTVAKLRKLKRLEMINCTNLTDAAIAAFQKARPDVTVTR